MKHLTLVFAAALLLAAAPAQALTVEDVLGLSRADASDAIILSQIDADGTVFHLTVDEIIELKEAGVSDVVITYMINTGKNVAVVEEEPAVEDAASEDDYYYEDAEEDDGDYGDEYSTDLDSAYRNSVHASFGYYYPHWPGYAYSFYYDPFRWDNWGYYYVYWSPYPYWNWYYYPWSHYYAYNYCYDYYNGNPYWRNYYGHGYYYDDDYAVVRHYKTGRVIGSRGDPAPGRRTAKNPTHRGDDGGRVAFNKTPRYTTPRDPKPDIGRRPSTVKKPGIDRSKINRPRNPAPPVRISKPARPSADGRRNQPRPPRTTVKPKRPNKPSKEAVRPAKPAPSKAKVMPAPRPSRPAPAKRPAVRPAPTRKAPSKATPSRGSTGKTSKSTKGKGN